MKRHVVILGAGFGGLELATCLSETASDVVNVTLIDRNDSFYFGFSKLEVMLGRESADAVRLPYREISKAGVDFRQERVVAIDPAARRVATDARTHDADFLVVAMGADYDMGLSGLGAVDCVSRGSRLAPRHSSASDHAWRPRRS